MVYKGGLRGGQNGRGGFYIYLKKVEFYIMSVFKGVGWQGNVYENVMYEQVDEASFRQYGIAVMSIYILFPLQ